MRCIELRDNKLGRDVAIKVLPESFAHDAERMARFEREAQVLASLNHPHIAGIYGLEESGGVSALVMELVEGEDLAQRLERGALPLDEGSVTVVEQESVDLTRRASRIDVAETSSGVVPGLM